MPAGNSCGPLGGYLVPAGTVVVTPAKGPSIRLFPIKITRCSAGAEKSRLGLRKRACSGRRRQIGTGRACGESQRFFRTQIRKNKCKHDKTHRNWQVGLLSYLKSGKGEKMRAAQCSQQPEGCFAFTFKWAAGVVRLHLHLMVPPVSTTHSDCLRTHSELRGGGEEKLESTSKMRLTAWSVKKKKKNLRMCFDISRYDGM